MLRVAHRISAPRRVFSKATTGERKSAFPHLLGADFGWTSAVTPTLASRHGGQWPGLKAYSTLSKESPSGGHRAPRRAPRYLKTLHPEKLHSAGQQILTFPGQRTVTMRLNAPDLADSLHPLGTSSWTLHLDAASSATVGNFRPEARGVFYYHSAEAQIRFRVCKTLEDYDKGSDLTLPNSRVWNLSLATMARKPQRYDGMLALIKHEFPIAPQDVDPNRDSHRLVSTFSPNKLITMNQRIFNISGMSGIQIIPSDKPPSTSIGYESTKFTGINKRLLFPDNTTGVFYYHQSHTSPMRVGELRFRLCSDIRAFDAGSDLLLPSGQPWHISAQSLYLLSSLKSVREHLIEEGLLDHPLYPGVAESQLSLDVAPLTSLGQPFVVDLSASCFTVKLISPNPHVASLDNVRVSLTFRRRAFHTDPIFNGRAVVCLEQYPSSPDASPLGPLFALRILEFLTPMKRVSSNKDILDLVPGQLVMHRYRKTQRYAPWGYSPTKSDTRAAITEWIRAQSNL